MWVEFGHIPFENVSRVWTHLLHPIFKMAHSREISTVLKMLFHIWKLWGNIYQEAQQKFQKYFVCALHLFDEYWRMCIFWANSLNHNEECTHRQNYFWIYCVWSRMIWIWSFLMCNNIFKIVDIFRECAIWKIGWNKCDHIHFTRCESNVPTFDS